MNIHQITWTFLFLNNKASYLLQGKEFSADQKTKGKTEFDFAYDEIELPLKHPNATIMLEDDDKSLELISELLVKGL